MSRQRDRAFSYFLGVLIVIIALISHNCCQAEEVAIQLHGLSWHADNSYNHNERNYGIAVRFYQQNDKMIWKNTAKYWTVGQYKNSSYRTSYYIGMGWQQKFSPDASIGLAIGLVTGYERAKIAPFIMPTVTIFDRLHLTGTLVPTPLAAVSYDIAKF